MKPTRLRNPSQPLLDFGEKLGITAEVWARREEPERIAYSDSALSREKAAGLTVDELTSLLEAYGDALTCEFTLGAMPVLTVVPGLDEAALAEFRNATGGSPTVGFNFALDKTRLVANWLGAVPGGRPFLYLFPGALEAFLASRLDRLESRLWGTEPARKVILLVPDREIWLNGPYLAVIGGKGIENWPAVVPKTTPDAGPVQRMYRTCREHLNWQHTWLQHLTPLHLKCMPHAVEGVASAAESDDRIAGALRVHRVNAIVLYTADRSVRKDDGTLVATYAGAQQSVELSLRSPADPLGEKTASGVEALTQMLEWTYESAWASDRLPLVQIGVVQALQAADPDVRYRLLLRNAADIFEGLQWHWQALIEHKIDAYVAQVRELEKDVDDMVQAVADQISEMIKSLSETMLAAVGALLGSFIAALFKDQFNPTIFAVGMVAYAVYVLVFPLGYNMLNQWGRYQALAENFGQRRRRFEGLLYQERVGEIVGTQVTDSQRRYQRWFWATVLAYAVVIILAVVAAAVVPGVMAGGVPTALPAGP